MVVERDDFDCRATRVTFFFVQRKRRHSARNVLNCKSRAELRTARVIAEYVLTYTRYDYYLPRGCRKFVGVVLYGVV